MVRPSKTSVWVYRVYRVVVAVHIYMLSIRLEALCNPCKYPLQIPYIERLRSLRTWSNLSRHLASSRGRTDLKSVQEDLGLGVSKVPDSYLYFKPWTWAGAILQCYNDICAIETGPNKKTHLACKRGTTTTTTVRTTTYTRYIDTYVHQCLLALKPCFQQQRPLCL